MLKFPQMSHRKVGHSNLLETDIFGSPEGAIQDPRAVQLRSLKEFFHAHPAAAGKSISLICKDTQTVRLDSAVARLMIPLLESLEGVDSESDEYDLSDFDKETVEAAIRIVRSCKVTAQDAALPRVIKLLYFLGIVMHIDDSEQALVWNLVCEQLTTDNCAQFLVLATLHNGGKAVIDAALALFASGIGIRYEPVEADESGISFNVTQRDD